jgi:hypothetical protein
MVIKSFVREKFEGKNSMTSDAADGKPDVHQEDQFYL